MFMITLQTGRSSPVIFTFPYILFIQCFPFHLSSMICAYLICIYMCIHTSPKDLVWWLIMIVSLTGCRITKETNLWKCLWGIFWTGLIEVGRLTPNVSGALPCVKVLTWIKSRTGADDQHSPMWQAALCSCHQASHLEGWYLLTCDLKQAITALVSPVRLSGLGNEKETNMLCFYSTFLKLIGEIKF